MLPIENLEIAALVDPDGRRTEAAAGLVFQKTGKKPLLDSDMRRIFERKMSERAEFVKRFYGDEAAYETAIDYGKKLGPLSRIRRGVDQEMSKVENGGPGTAEERGIGPAQRYAPGELDKGRTPARVPSPAPVPAEPRKEPAPGVQRPPPAPEEKTPPER